ncbi:vitamin K epoxide reductase family protein [Chthonomonas calidirosea]|uniref:vitamin K epoxide reductase family protein n=1 Tax=Chthonomonas calidirosea TaxID=454171 RepID=UPI0006EC9359|nr:vitamin K epoxide reductase family protein [Chthonomonas calidirosea]CEK15041.1 protein-disulfide isomerase [Chthonomonas calidirosea]
MKRILTNNITLFLSAFGTLLAGYLTLTHFMPSAPLPCSMKGAGCTEILHGPYSHLGPIPTAAFGLGMYLLVFVLALLRRKLLPTAETIPAALPEPALAQVGASQETTSALSPVRQASIATVSDWKAALAPADLARLLLYDRLIWLLTAAGFCISWWLQYIAIFVQRSFCPYCFTSALTVTTLAAIAWYDYVQQGRPLNSEQKMLGLVLGFILVLLGFIYVPGIVGMLGSSIYTGPVQHSINMRSILVRPGSHIYGNPKAKYILVEFADYNCPHCAEAAQALPDLLKSHPDICLVFRNFPLGLDTVLHFTYSGMAAQAAEAAALQGKFWQYHDLLFKNQSVMQAPGFSPSQFADFARSLGMDVQKFTADMNSPAIIQRVRQDYMDGLHAHVNSTPTFFLITPNHIYSFIGIDEFEKLLKEPNNEVWK